MSKRSVLVTALDKDSLPFNRSAEISQAPHVFKRKQRKKKVMIVDTNLQVL